jgi:hypothetical protein
MSRWRTVYTDLKLHTAKGRPRISGYPRAKKEKHYSARRIVVPSSALMNVRIRRTPVFCHTYISKQSLADTEDVGIFPNPTILRIRLGI